MSYAPGPASPDDQQHEESICGEHCNGCEECCPEPDEPDPDFVHDSIRNGDREPPTYDWRRR